MRFFVSRGRHNAWNLNNVLVTTGSMLKAELNNKGIQWGLSNPNPLGMEVFRRSEMFTCMNSQYRGNLYSEHGTSIYTNSQGSIAESNLLLTYQQEKLKQLSKWDPKIGQSAVYVNALYCKLYFWININIKAAPGLGLKGWLMVAPLYAGKDIGLITEGKQQVWRFWKMNSVLHHCHCSTSLLYKLPTKDMWDAGIYFCD